MQHSLLKQGGAIVLKKNESTEIMQKKAIYA